MSLTLLRAFHLVAEAGGFSRAAQVARVSQPTLSAQVRALEQAHAVSLFDRKGRAVLLTPSGRALHEITTRLFTAADEAAALLAGSRALTTGHLRVVADGTPLVMPLLARLKAQHPGLTFSLSMANSTEVLDQLLAHDADIGFSAKPTPDPRLHAQRLRADRIVLFTPAGHAVAARGGVRIADIAGHDLIVRERGSVTREVFEAHLSVAGIKPRAVIEVQTREAVKEAVRAGFGLGIIFRGELGDDPAFAAVEIEDADLEVAEYLVCLESRRRLPLIRAVLALGRETNLTGSAPARP